MSEEFDAWYALYPRKVAKGAARKAFAKARKIASQDVLCAAATAFAAKASDKQFIPYPATWLNQERWLDEEPRKTVSNVADPEKAFDRVNFALKGIYSANFSRADILLALRAGKITEAQARRLGI